VLSPDGYTILPMRLPTTIRTTEIFMVELIDRKFQGVNASGSKKNALSPSPRKMEAISERNL